MHLNSLFELTIAHALPICRSSCLFHLARNLPCCNSVYGSRDAQPPKPLYMAVSSPLCLLKQTTRIESPKLQMKTSTLSVLCSTEYCQSEEPPSSPDQGQQKRSQLQPAVVSPGSDPPIQHGRCEGARLPYLKATEKLESQLHETSQG